MFDQTVRTRVAPSPTGDPHVGTAYQALFNLAFARGHSGRFVLRIEDTDQARSTPESEAAILDSLRWLGIEWDEGPDRGGPNGPYRQSERLGVYHEHVDLLLERGHAYRCFCTRERLDEMRSRQGAATGYDRHCREIAPTESARRAGKGEEHVVRMKVPLEGECLWEDLLRGTIAREWSLVDDQVILKSDGFPTYHLAVVVDDQLMGISHVLRGEEWINSVPKHVQLYKYFGWKPPVFCHLPLLRNNDANKSKLSKRKNPTSINYYRRAGYLPEAMLNFLGMMGWVMPDGEEKFSLEDMVRHLKLKDISLGGPVFDTAKLRWLNGRYLRENHTPEQLLTRLRDWAINDDYLARIVPEVQPRLETMGDWGFLTAPFFADTVEIDPEDIRIKGKEGDEVAAILQMTLWKLDTLRDFRAEPLQELFKEMAEAYEIKLRDFLLPFYVALSGKAVWTPLFASMEVLGSDMSRARIRRALEIKGGVSKKKLKKLEKEFAERFAPQD